MLNHGTVRDFYEGVLSSKYLRKYAHNKMMELGMPKSAANFVEGRAAHTVGGHSYMWGLQQAPIDTSPSMHATKKSCFQSY